MSTFKHFSQPLTSGFVVAIVGFFSSFPIVLQGIKSIGANEAQAASGLMMAAIAMGVAGILLSLWKKMPISVAWSTPGVALLAVTLPIEDGFAGAIAGFIIAGALTILAGLWRPLGKFATSVPAPLAQAMLAGVLVSLCIAPFKAMADVPLTAIPVVITWFVIGRFNRLFAVPAAVIAALGVTGFANDFSMTLPENIIALPIVTVPVFSISAFLSIGLPLFIVTMATQNIPGIAVLKANGYTPAAGPLFTGVGLVSVASAPFGAPATCLAAITAAMCASEDSHKDPTQRYWTAVISGGLYCVFGLFAILITSVAILAPPMLLETLAGVALLGVFANSASAALGDPDYREAAAVTFLVTASGITVYGLGAAVWGLIAGGIVVLTSKQLKKA